MSETGIISLSLVPGRKEPSDPSEMVTQLLFGEQYTVIESQEKWVKIQGELDGYVCWIDKKMHTPTPFSSVKKITRHHGDCWVDENSGKKIMLCPGSIIREKNTFAGDDGSHYQLQSNDTNLTLEQAALSFENAPYLWGGKSLMGIDCSGFTQVVMRMMGIDLPRDAYQQEEIGTHINVEQAQKGDLAYFKSAGSARDKVTHVGIVLDDHKIIHASGRVRIDDLTAQGIRKANSEEYSHELISVKRMG